MRFWSKSKHGDKKMSTKGRSADSELNDRRNGVWSFTHFFLISTWDGEEATFQTTLATFSSQKHLATNVAIFNIYLATFDKWLKW